MANSTAPFAPTRLPRGFASSHSVRISRSASLAAILRRVPAIWRLPTRPAISPRAQKTFPFRSKTSPERLFWITPTAPSKFVIPVRPRKTSPSITSAPPSHSASRPRQASKFRPTAAPATSIPNSAAALSTPTALTRAIRISKASTAPRAVPKSSSNPATTPSKSAKPPNPDDSSIKAHYDAIAVTQLRKIHKSFSQNAGKHVKCLPVFKWGDLSDGSNEREQETQRDDFKRLHESGLNTVASFSPPKTAPSPVAWSLDTGP